MNEAEYLLTVLAEELAETQQVIAKALRFGLDSQCPVTNETNKQGIAVEFAQAVGVMEMLEERGIIKRD